MTQLALDLDAQARDRALDLFDQHRSFLVSVAHAIAEEIAREHGRVSSPEVLSTMKARGYEEALQQVDRRFMGAVFREGRGWRRVGFENKGSHKRPVSIWAPKDAA
jgi:hypothetical protein